MEGEKQRGKIVSVLVAATALCGAFLVAVLLQDVRELRAELLAVRNEGAWLREQVTFLLPPHLKRRRQLLTTTTGSDGLTHESSDASTVLAISSDVGVDVEDTRFVGSYIGTSSDTDLLQLASALLTVAGDIKTTTGNYAFLAAMSTAQHNTGLAQNAVMPYADEELDVGNCFGSNKFTAEVAGYYHFFVNMIAYHGGSNDVELEFYKNGVGTDYTMFMDQGSSNSMYKSGSFSTNIQLAADDEVTVVNVRSTFTPFVTSTQKINVFGGHLISAL